MIRQPSRADGGGQRAQASDPARHGVTSGASSPAAPCVAADVRCRRSSVPSPVLSVRGMSGRSRPSTVFVAIRACAPARYAAATGRAGSISSSRHASTEWCFPPAMPRPSISPPSSFSPQPGSCRAQCNRCPRGGSVRSFRQQRCSGTGEARRVSRINTGGENTGGGTVYRVVDTGIRCIRAPCFSLRATVVNGTRLLMLSGLDLDRAEVPPALGGQGRRSSPACFASSPSPERTVPHARWWRHRSGSRHEGGGRAGTAVRSERRAAGLTP